MPTPPGLASGFQRSMHVCRVTFFSATVIMNEFFFCILFGVESLMRVRYPKKVYGPYCELSPIENDVPIIKSPIVCRYPNTKCTRFNK